MIQANHFAIRTVYTRRYSPFGTLSILACSDAINSIYSSVEGHE